MRLLEDFQTMWLSVRSLLIRQKLIKNAKNGQFRRVFENLKLSVKQCYQTGQFLNWSKIPGKHFLNETFLMIFKQCVLLQIK